AAGDDVVSPASPVPAPSVGVATPGTTPCNPDAGRGDSTSCENVRSDEFPAAEIEPEIYPPGCLEPVATTLAPTGPESSTAVTSIEPLICDGEIEPLPDDLPPEPELPEYPEPGDIEAMEVVLTEAEPV